MFTAAPNLPSKLRRLREIAYNLWWSWDQEASDLFRQLAPDLWETTCHNPALMLETVSQKRLQELAHDKGFLANLEHVGGKFDEYMDNKRTWYEKTRGAGKETCIAYFSAEFGLTECLPIYSGGLGILAGDHLKSASDLGLPVVGVGLLYQEGYFSQYLRRDGRQGELYPSNDFHNTPIQLQRQVRT
jgi:starch phosphorylase